jgi:hypothetical protein
MTLSLMTLAIKQGILKWEVSFTIDLLFDWFGINCMTTDNFSFYLPNRLIQTSRTGGQRYIDTSPFSIPCIKTNFHYAECHCAECRDLFIVMRSVIMLIVVMLSVVMLSVVMLRVFMLCVVMLSVIMLSVAT